MGRFDARAQTLVALRLRAAPVPAAAHVTMPPGSPTPLGWHEPAKIARLLHDPKFAARCGSPTVLCLLPSYIFVGTEAGTVVAFTYRQELVLTLAPGPQEPTLEHATAGPLGSVTCVAASLSHVAAGYSSGHVAVWPLTPPAHVIGPVSANARALFSQEGHRYGVAVTSVAFLDGHGEYLVLADALGLCFFHHVFKSFLKTHSATHELWDHRIAQRAHQATDSASGNATDGGPVSVHMLPPSEAHYTDALGVAAIMAPDLMAIVSVRSLNTANSPRLRTFYKARPKTSGPANAAWYPRIPGHAAKLAYSWNHVILVLEMVDTVPPDLVHTAVASARDKDKAVPPLRFRKLAKFTAQHPVVALRWLNSEVLTALVRDHTSTETSLLLLYYQTDSDGHSLHQVGVDPLDSQQVSPGPFANYAHLYEVLSHRAVVLVNSNLQAGKSLVTGKAYKWGDRLLEHIAHGDFLNALRTVYAYYTSPHAGSLVLCGLPHTNAERHAMVRPVLVKIMREAVGPLLVTADVADFPETCSLYFSLVVTVAASSAGAVDADLLEVLDQVHDTLTDPHDKDTFYQALQDAVVARQICNVLPAVFRGLVEHLVAKNEGETLTQLVCLLDALTLDIDTVLRLGEQYQLRECVAYVWNTVLHDFETPFWRLFHDLDSALPHTEKCLVYTYISYVLSGRQFPSDEFMDPQDEARAFSALLAILFGDDSSQMFPTLHTLLRFDSFRCLSTLNEVFESTALNTEDPLLLSRQSIVNTLLDVYRVHAASFSDADKTNLAIFIARNYPKFLQFLRLPDSVLEECLELLSTGPDDVKDDCELALESLLTVHTVKSDKLFLEQILAAGFYNVAISLYKSQHRYSKVVEILFQQHHDFYAFSLIVASALRGSKLEFRKLGVVVGANFEALVNLDTPGMVAVVESFYPELHVKVLDCKSDETALKYLEELFKSHMLCTQAQKNKLLAAFVALYARTNPQKTATLVKAHLTALCESPHLEDVQHSLTSTGCSEAGATLLEHNGQTEEAIKTLVDGVGKAQDAEQAERLVTEGIAICQKHDDQWLAFTQALVPLTVGNNPDLVATINQGIYRCFRSLVERDRKNPQAPIFSKVLDAVMESATLYNVRQVIQEVLTAYYFENEMHLITYAKVNGEIVKKMTQLRSLHLQGWLIREKTCTSCGKAMWGSGHLLRHMAAYEARQRVLVMGGGLDTDPYTDCMLVLFGCGHGYHGACLLLLGSEGRCVICAERRKALDA